ncbi:MAG TPA: hypothetical protein VK102_03600 [Sphingobacterium sp.]|nr:hypothetical protein [Sphingobacterium sp.]
MKKTHIFLIVSLIYCLTYRANAQINCPSPDGRYDAFNKNHFTLGAGPTFLYGDINDRKSNIGVGVQAKYDRKIWKGILIGAEFQLGNLKTEEALKDTLTEDMSEGVPDPARRVNNFYKSISLNLTIHPFHYFTGSIWDRNETVGARLLNGFYVGAGVGVVLNDYQSLYIDSSPRTDGVKTEDPQGNLTYQEYVYSPIAPVINTGLVFPFTSTDLYYQNKGVWSAVANAQMSFSTNDLLDGYNPTIEGNISNDVYTFYTLGLRYSF